MPSSRLLLLLVLVAASACCARALRLKGSVDSRLSAAEDVFIGSFKFQQDGGAVSISGVSRTEGQRVLFFDETVANWAIILETYNTMSCMELQKVSLVITEDADDGRVAEGVAIPNGPFSTTVTMIPTDKPRRWYVMLANCNGLLDLDYDFVLTNPGGFFERQFGADQAGVLEVVIFLTVSCAVYSTLWCKRLYEQVLRGSSRFHPALKIFCVALGLNLFGLLFQFIHGAHFAENGTGLPLLQALGEVMEWLSVFILCGLLCMFAQGWTITEIQLELSQYTKTGSACLVGGMIALLVAERMLRDFATSTVFESGAGLFTLLVRCLIGAVFLSKMKETISNCASPQREPFLRAFAIAGACFFFALPLLALLLFLFANNCSIARNLTLIAGLSQLLGLSGLGFILWPKAHNSYVVIDDEKDNPYDGL